MSETDVALVALSVTEMKTAPPFCAVQFVNVVGDSGVPLIIRVFPSSSVAEMTAPPSEERVRWVNEEDVMDRLALVMERRGALSENGVVLVGEGVSVSVVRVTAPDVAEMREYPSEDADVVNVIKEISKLHPEQMKRESFISSDDINGFVTAVSL